jgi:hypothetical protein
MNMKLSDVKSALPTMHNVQFKLENGDAVPEHFHVTEIGITSKHFIDCGGTIRTEKKVNFQLWDANDFEHRLKPQKLLNIINLSEKKLDIEDLEIEVEYQAETIGKYSLEIQGDHFVLINQRTACLASDKCGIPESQLKSSPVKEACCTPGGGCC